MYVPFMFNEMNNSNMFQAKKTHPRAKFTKEEDEMLKNLVESFGDNNWQVISNKMPGRNPRQCRERWQNYLSPDVKNGPWTQEEDDLLIRKYNELGPSWKLISSFFPTRTDINIKSRWNLRERHLKKENLKIKKALFQKKLALNPSAAYEMNIMQTQPLNNNMQMFQHLPMNQQINQRYETINQPVIKETVQFQNQSMINSDPLPFFSKEDQVDDGNEHEMNLIFDDGYDLTANDCWNSILMNEEASFDSWF